MNQEEILKLANTHANVLTNEHAAKIDLANAQANTASVKAQELAKAYEVGEIDGKNADIRKAQETAFLAGNHAVGNAIMAEGKAEQKAIAAEIERKRVETIVSLTRAWLYSQAGVNGA
jgi:hypothetical protein